MNMLFKTNTTCALYLIQKLIIDVLLVTSYNIQGLGERIRIMIANFLPMFPH